MYIVNWIGSDLIELTNTKHLFSKLESGFKLVRSLTETTTIMETDFAYTVTKP